MNDKTQKNYSISHSVDDSDSLESIQALKAYGSRRGISFSFLVIKAIGLLLNDIKDKEAEAKEVINGNKSTEI